MSAAYQFMEEVCVVIPVSPHEVFAHVDDQAKLGSHMEKPSLMMLGGRMIYELDEGAGQKVGSVIRMKGVWPGLTLSVEEVVTARNPPHLKTWETKGTPNLLVIGAYRMGFVISPAGDGARLCVIIEYSHPTSTKFLGRLFGRMYARWCVKRMAMDAARVFGASAPVQSARHI
jgi:hypothetical protein